MQVRISHENGKITIYKKAQDGSQELMCREELIRDAIPLNCRIVRTSGEDISFLEGLRIVFLEILGPKYGDSNDIASLKSLNGIQHLSDLRILHLFDVPISDMSGIEFCENLEEFVVSSKIEDFSLLSGLPLKTLEILATPSHSFFPATGIVLPFLKILSINYSTLDWLAGWTEVPYHEVLLVSDCDDRSNEIMEEHPAVVRLRLRNPSLRLTACNF